MAARREIYQAKLLANAEANNSRKANQINIPHKEFWHDRKINRQSL